ncbi:tRNA pseudouridine(55) synthase TruB, partial [Patescibacteria group bacterium]|nr:tRNA pseudouridine(55) synthase TruB [Patescibacteria group bacterium]
MNGFLLVDKPAAWTSHDVVAVLRGMTGIRQIGHAGTLDPFATGLLVVGVGAATKQLDAVHAFDKEYVATIRFGATSDTDDCDGVITPSPTVPDISAAMLENALQTFRGAIQQTPPMYSAKKVGGRKLYDLAREGKTVVREPVSVTVHEISIVEVALPETAILRITCSTGTYIRALARDIGTALGTGAYCAALRRARI